MAIPSIAIIGPGKVGTALGVLAVRAGLHVAAIGGGRRCNATTAARIIGGNVKAMPAAEAASCASLVLLTVSDDAIESVCQELVSSNALLPGAIVAHCCGAKSSEVLNVARSLCCELGSFHPLQTFPTVEAAIERLPGTYVFIEGDSTACSALEEFAKAIGGIPQRISAQGKALYHAGAAMASNYLVALLDAASCLTASALTESDQANRVRALHALEPLVRATLDNVLAMGAEAALTGPIARGDVATIQAHLESIARSTPELLEAYKALGKLTVELAARKGTLAPEKSQELLDLLE